ncbi:universal stress protein [Nonomuraea rubra]|uniref:universal stress protein n=1 Tax=Nonomuraea rubra TaxID=46180 RepID=UPI0036126BCE
MRFHRIVAGADGTRNCEAALLWAAEQAVGRGERLLVVHAWEPRVPYRAPYARQPAHDDLAYEQLHGDAALNRALTLVGDRFPGIRVEGRLVPGRPESVLAEQARGPICWCSGRPPRSPGTAGWARWCCHACAGRRARW